MPNGSILTAFGHLGRDAELKTVGDNSVCEFSIAVTHKRGRDESTAWYRAQVWGNRAEKLAPMLTKGKAVLIVGDLLPREYKGKNDELRTSLDVRVHTLEFLGGQAGGDAAARKEETAFAGGRKPSTPSSPADSDEESLPF